MSHFDPLQRERLVRSLSRRQFFSRLGTGAGALALAALLQDQAVANGPDNPQSAHTGVRMDAIRNPQFPHASHFPARAKRIIYLFQNGGPSHVDLFDPKPELKKRDGSRPAEGFVNDVDAKKTGAWLGSPFEFRKFGQSGLELSELLPGLGAHADDVAVIRSMVSEHENHEQACGHMHTGSPVAGRPTMGSWVTYGLGTMNADLPAFVVLLNPGGLPVDGARNWTSGWLPPTYEGLPVRASDSSPVLNLEPRVPREAATARLRFLQSLNRQHLRAHPGSEELEARIASFELAAGMQLAATDALDLRSEPAATRALYGLDQADTATYGRQLLMARRLVERGVRFVQVMMSGQPWDTHSDNNAQLRSLCRATDPPVSALLTDLKARGLLEDTLVIWTGEFGRTPFSEGKDGRDHHKRAFSLWLAGGGVRGGVTVGATDDFGYASVKDIVTVADLHGTLLHLLGLDHHRLTFRHDTRDERLTDIHEAKIVSQVVS